MQEDRRQVTIFEHVSKDDREQHPRTVLDLKSVPIEPRFPSDAETQGYVVDWQLETVNT